MSSNDVALYAAAAYGLDEEHWPCPECGKSAKVRTPREGDMLLKGPTFRCPGGDEFRVDWASIRAVNRANVERKLIAGVRAGVIQEPEMLATRLELERVRQQEAEMEAKPWRGL